jgi:hypothetical protein
MVRLSKQLTSLSSENQWAPTRPTGSKSVQLLVNFSENIQALPKSHMHIFHESVSVKFEECQPKGVRGVDFTK